MFLSVVFCFLLLEIYLRLIPLKAKQSSDLWIDNLEFQYPVHLNSHHFRDDEFYIEKAPNTFRVLLIGDSFIYGAGVPTAFTLDKILERKLQNRNSQFHYEVYNLGIIGIDPPQYYELAKQFQKYNPDFVIVSFYVDNDVRADELKNHFRLTGWVNSMGEVWDVFLWKTGFTDCIFPWLKEIRGLDADYLKLACEGKINPHLFRRGHIPNQYLHYQDLAKLFSKDPYTSDFLMKIRNLFPKTPYLLLIQASKYQVSSAYFKDLIPFGFNFPNQRLLGREIQDAILDWAHQNSVETLDLLPAMQGAQDKNFYHRIDDHYNVQGNEFAADWVARYLENKIGD